MRIVDGILDLELYYFLVNHRNEFNYRHLDSYKGQAHKYEAELGKELTAWVKKNYAERVMEPQGNFKVGIVKCDPVYHYNMHADHPSKIISSVVYLHPKKSTGTIFEQDNLEVEWRPNRLIAWENRGQRHFYENRTSQPRYTLNIYQTDGDHTFRNERVRGKSVASI